MKNKKTRRFKIRYIVFGLLGVMALAALVFMRFGGFGTGENVNPEEFLAYAEPVENITVPESAKIIALGEATHGNAEFQQLKLEVFKQMVKNNGVRAFALEGDYGGCEQVNRYIHGGEGTAQEAAAAIGFSIYRTEEMAELILKYKTDEVGESIFLDAKMSEEDEKNERRLSEALSEVMTASDYKKVEEIILYLEDNKYITPQLAEKLTGKSAPTVRRYLKMLVETGYVKVDGSTSNIRYVI